MKHLFFCLFMFLGLSNIAFGQLSAERQKFLEAYQKVDSTTMITLLREWGQKDPDNIEYRVSQARFDYRSNKISLDSLVLVLDHAIETSPRILDFRFYKVNHLSDSSCYYPKVSRELVKLNDAFQKSPLGCSMYGQTLTTEEFNQLFGNFSASILEAIGDSGSIEQAEQFYNELASGSLDDDALLILSYQMGLSYFEADKYPEAIEIFKQALEKCSDSQRAPIQFLIALNNYYLGNEKEALKYAKLADKGGDRNARELIDNIKMPMRTERYYNFVYQLMPQLLSSMPVSAKSFEVLQKPQRFVETLKHNKIRINRDLSGITPIVVASQLGDIVVWTMPVPDEIPEPKYVAFVPGEDGYIYYTLEKTFDFDGEYRGTPFVLGGASFQKGDIMASHFNTGSMVDGDCTPETLVKLIEEVQKK